MASSMAEESELGLDKGGRKLPNWDILGPRQIRAACELGRACGLEGNPSNGTSSFFSTVYLITSSIKFLIRPHPRKPQDGG